MKKMRVKSYKKLDIKHHVYDLNVCDNHNFFIGNSGILTHNCDYLTINGQAALRALMETYSQHTRFILTCNYVERLIEPIISRCQTFELVPPSKKDVATHVFSILRKENITAQPADLKFVIDSTYPDIRRIINSLQRQVVNGVLTLDKKAMVDADYKLKVLDVLKNDSINKKDAFRDIRQILADNSISDFSDMYKLLYENIESYAKGHLAPVILILAESQYKDSMVVDHEISFAACIIQILNEIKK